MKYTLADFYTEANRLLGFTMALAEEWYNKLGPEAAAKLMANVYACKSNPKG
jgi:hypothetical protein